MYQPGEQGVEDVEAEFTVGDVRWSARLTTVRRSVRSGSLPRGRISRFLPRTALARQKYGSCGTLRTSDREVTRAISRSAPAGSV